MCRSTEGSGLGLSIARSLTMLMGGQLLLEIDGDLFKATVILPLVEEDRATRAGKAQEQRDVHASKEKSTHRKQEVARTNIRHIGKRPHLPELNHPALPSLVENGSGTQEQQS